MKKSSKLNFISLYASFGKHPIISEQESFGSAMSPNKNLNLNEIMMLNSSPEIAILKTVSQETLLLNPYELKKIVEDRSNEISFIQKLISKKISINEEKQQSKEDFYQNFPDKSFRNQAHFETYYCKYSRNLVGGVFSVYLKNTKVICSIYFLPKLYILDSTDKK